MNKWPCFVVCAAVLLSAAARADDEEQDEEGRRCINTRSIRDIDVINDSTIVFHTQGNRHYRNSLPRRCYGLSRERRFSYTSRTGNLCANDFINPLDDIGSGLISSRSCRLGRFQPTTEEEIADFEERLSAPVEARPPEPPPPQEVIPDDDEDADGQGGERQ